MPEFPDSPNPYTCEIRDLLDQQELLNKAKTAALYYMEGRDIWLRVHISASREDASDYMLDRGAPNSETELWREVPLRLLFAGGAEDKQRFKVMGPRRRATVSNPSYAHPYNHDYLLPNRNDRPLRWYRGSQMTAETYKVFSTFVVETTARILGCLTGQTLLSELQYYGALPVLYPDTTQAFRHPVSVERNLAVFIGYFLFYVQLGQFFENVVTSADLDRRAEETQSFLTTTHTIWRQEGDTPWLLLADDKPIPFELAFKNLCQHCHKSPMATYPTQAHSEWTVGSFYREDLYETGYPRTLPAVLGPSAHRALHALIRWKSPTAEGRWCVRCVTESTLRWCENHTGYYSTDESETASSGVACNACVPLRFDTRIRNYSWKPDHWVFYADKKEPSEPEPGTLFMGMELETAFKGPTSTWQNRYPSMMGELGNTSCPDRFITGKTDSSVNDGIEFVTHPFTFRWAQKNFPFEWFDWLIKTHRAQATSTNCGAHVHVSRKSFSQSHLWKFLAVHHEMTTLLGVYGRRGTTAAYGRLANSTITQLKEKGYKIDYVKHGVAALNDKGIYPDRDGVNLTGQHTIELRYPAGASSQKLIRTNMEMVQSIYDFSKHITVRHIREGVLQDPGYLTGWVIDHKEIYPNLHKLQQSAFPESKSLV